MGKLKGICQCESGPLLSLRRRRRAVWGGVPRCRAGILLFFFMSALSVGIGIFFRLSSNGSDSSEGVVLGSRCA